MIGRFADREFKLGRCRHMMLCALGWSVFCVGGSLSGQLLAKPGFGLIGGAGLLATTVLANGVWQLTLNLVRLRELNLSSLHAAWILVLHCAVALLSQAGDPLFFVTAVLLLCAKSALFLWPDAHEMEPLETRRQQARLAQSAGRKLLA